MSYIAPWNRQPVLAGEYVSGVGAATSLDYGASRAPVVATVFEVVVLTVTLAFTSVLVSAIAVAIL
jgi:hypothetical protein